LFNWLFARQHGGQFILRIDDTDQQRNVQEALRPILEGFRWLGIDWDEGPEVGGPCAPYYQSQRADRHRAAVTRLLDAGLAYRDYARPEELQAERELAEREKRHFVYSRRWLAADDADAARFEAEGRRAVVRLKMHRDGACQFPDLIRGPMEFAWANEQDHVIQRADGSCLYHLASVVDDHDFQITHVIRAEEHLSNTPRQIFIAQGLGYDLPTYAHLPYVAEPGSSNKLSKRKLNQYLKNPDFQKLFQHGQQVAAAAHFVTAPDTFNPVIVDFYREVGYLPAAILNYLLLLGWSLDDHTELFTCAEMIQHFSLERVNKAPASFDPQKLWAFQLRYMQGLSVPEKISLVLPYLQRVALMEAPPTSAQAARLEHVVQAAGDRIKTAGDILEFTEFFVADEALVIDEKASQKRFAVAGTPELLRRLRDRLATVSPFTAAATEAVLRDFVEAEQIKIGDLIHPLRLAVTGKTVGLGMFDALAILGRDQSLARIDRALARVC
jgi:glutamyl-tRNA synthetase